ncbi:MAG: Ig-like domain-containing protein, partial [Thalassotalea sp.]
ITDSAGETDTSTLTISVTAAVNIPPVAENDTFSIDESGSVSGNIITHNDGDGVVDHDGGDGSILMITHINGTALTFDANGFATVNVDGGELIISENGNFTYVNTEGYVLGDSYPSFEYTLSDGTDSASAFVTIDINDSAPEAVDDFNYLDFESYEGVTDPAGVIGNVITGGSSGDNIDRSVDGDIRLVQFNFNGQDFVFDDSRTSFVIDTGFGQFTMYNTGAYELIIPEGIPVDMVPSNFQIVYTIEDGDAANPETDSATLNIDLIHYNENVVADQPSSEGQLIDLSNSEQVSENSIASENETSAIDYDISELMSAESSESLDGYFFIEVDNAAQNSQSDELLSAINEVDTEATVTNTLLTEGATLISDASPESVPPQIELDSTDHI